jgi:etoposide-induced 2.4 mRNA
MLPDGDKELIGSIYCRASEIRNGVIKGFLLSATIVAVIFFFELAFFPTHLFPTKELHSQNDDSAPYLDQSSFGSTFWLYPLIAGSYYLASSWTLDVAQATYRLKHGRSLSMGFSPQLPSGFSRKAILESHRVLLVINYTIISLALQQIPWFGRWLSFAFMVSSSSRPSVTFSNIYAPTVLHRCLLLLRASMGRKRLVSRAKDAIC